HPEEIRSFLTAVRNIYPGKEICGIFQPHLYSRTRDFAEQFAEVLALLDQVILMDIYPAREAPIPGITSEYLLSLIPKKNKLILKRENIMPYLSEHKPQVLLTIGAGDIDKLIPEIKKLW
ncbi:MAG: cyanophycin synthetase, partial [Bacteroidales bacterium]